MTEKPVLTREQMKASYPNQWLLVTDCGSTLPRPCTKAGYGRAVKIGEKFIGPLRSIRETLRLFHRQPFSGYRGSILMARVT